MARPSIPKHLRREQLLLVRLRRSEVRMIDRIRRLTGEKSRAAVMRDALLAYMALHDRENEA